MNPRELIELRGGNDFEIVRGLSKTISDSFSTHYEGMTMKQIQKAVAKEERKEKQAAKKQRNKNNSLLRPPTTASLLPKEKGEETHDEEEGTLADGHHTDYCKDIRDLMVYESNDPELVLKRSVRPMWLIEHESALESFHRFMPIDLSRLIPNEALYSAFELFFNGELPVLPSPNPIAETYKITTLDGTRPLSGKWTKYIHQPQRTEFSETLTSFISAVCKDEESPISREDMSILLKKLRDKIPEQTFDRSMTNYSKDLESSDYSFDYYMKLLSRPWIPRLTKKTRFNSNHAIIQNSLSNAGFVIEKGSDPQIPLKESILVAIQSNAEAIKHNINKAALAAIKMLYDTAIDRSSRDPSVQPIMNFLFRAVILEDLYKISALISSKTLMHAHKRAKGCFYALTASRVLASSDLARSFIEREYSVCGSDYGVNDLPSDIVLHNLAALDSVSFCMTSTRDDARKVIDRVCRVWLTDSEVYKGDHKASLIQALMSFYSFESCENGPTTAMGDGTGDSVFNKNFPCLVIGKLLSLYTEAYDKAPLSDDPKSPTTFYQDITKRLVLCVANRMCGSRWETLFLRRLRRFSELVCMTRDDSLPSLTTEDGTYRGDESALYVQASLGVASPYMDTIFKTDSHKRIDGFYTAILIRNMLWIVDGEISLISDNVTLANNLYNEGEDAHYMDYGATLMKLSTMMQVARTLSDKVGTNLDQALSTSIIELAASIRSKSAGKNRVHDDRCVSLSDLTVLFVDASFIMSCFELPYFSGAEVAKERLSLTLSMDHKHLERPPHYDSSFDGSADEMAILRSILTQ